MESTVQISPARFVTIELASMVTGLTPKAIRRKIEDGIWADGIHYRRAPDNRLYVDLKEFEQWVVNNGSSRHVS